MIRYTLSCDNDHQFDSWFQSAEAFDRLLAAGMVACSACGSTAVSKALMAPSVHHGKGGAAPSAKAEAEGTAHPLGQPANETEAALAALRRHVEENSEYVGMNFATEARAMHDGDMPERAIYGEARPDDARRLIEDGVPVAPLPFRPVRRSN